MKNLFYSIIALCSLTAFGQEKTYSFDKKVSYKISLPDDYKAYFGDKGMFLNTYLSKDALLGTFEGGLTELSSSEPFNHESFFIQNNRVFEVITNSLENRLSIKVPSYYEGIDEKYLQPYDDNFIGSYSSIKNLNSTQTINGYTCSDYEVLTKNEYEEKTLKFCVDTKNQLNNMSYLLPKANVKGLLIRIDDGNFSGFTIDKVSNSSAKISFDEKNQIEAFNQEIAKKKEEYKATYEAADSLAVAVDSAASAFPDNRYDDPLMSYYFYANSENENVNSVFNTIASFTYNLVQKDEDYDGEFDYDRTKALKVAQGSTKQIVKQYKKNGLINNSESKELNKLFDKLYNDAKEFKISKDSNYTNAVADEAYATAEVDSAVSAADYYDPYISTYKKDDISIIDLAIDNPDVKDFLKIAPEHCKDLKSKIPTFSDKELGNLVHNYAGQTCDLYIYNSGSVGLPQTINALRKSVLEINNKYDKLKKEDKEKLTTFLNSLD